jgi:hypothetical protein
MYSISKVRSQVDYLVLIISDSKGSTLLAS